MTDCPAARQLHDIIEDGKTQNGLALFGHINRGVNFMIKPVTPSGWLSPVARDCERGGSAGERRRRVRCVQCAQGSQRGWGGTQVQELVKLDQPELQLVSITVGRLVKRGTIAKSDHVGLRQTLIRRNVIHH
jgi:hypothetical protein